MSERRPPKRVDAKGGSTSGDGASNEPASPEAASARETRQAPREDSRERELLVARAAALGIEGAAKLTSAELRAETASAERGPSGATLVERAAGWLRSVVEKGLTRSAREREEAPLPELPDPILSAPASSPVVDEIRRAQGLAPAEEAAAQAGEESSSGVVAAAASAVREEPPAAAIAPSSPESLGAISHLSAGDFVQSAPTPAPAAVASMLDEAPWPARYDVDECVALAVDPATLYVYWELRPATIARAERALLRGAPADAQVVGTLRVLAVEPDANGPRATTRDIEIVDAGMGEYFVRDLPAGSVLRAAVGLRLGERFLPLAHTLEVEAPAPQPAPTIASAQVVWSERGVRPAAPDERFVAAAMPLDESLDALDALDALEPDPSLVLPELPPVGPLRTDDLPPGVGLSSAELAERRQRADRWAQRRLAKAKPGASEQLAQPPSSDAWRLA